MTFSLSVNAQSDEARSLVAHSDCPQPVKDFARDAILALAKENGDNVVVGVSVSGYINASGGSLSMNIYKAQQPQPIADDAGDDPLPTEETQGGEG